MNQYWHGTAIASYNKYIADGIDEKHAAEQVLAENREAAKHGPLFFSAKKARRLANPTKLRHELHLVAWMCKKGIPFNAVDDKLFREYHRDYKWQLPPSRKRIADSLLPLVYEYVQDQQKLLFKQVDFCAITADGATDVAMRKHVAITYHFITKQENEWKLNSIVGDLIAFDEADAWQELARAIGTRLAARLPDTAYVTTIVTDKGANMVKARAALMNNLHLVSVEGSFVPEPELLAMNERAELDRSGAAARYQQSLIEDPTAYWDCVDHSMQSAVMTDVLGIADGTAPRAMKEALTRVRFLVNHVRNSAKAQTALDALSRRLNLPVLRLITDVGTRWLSTYDMLARFNTFWPRLARLILDGVFDDYDGHLLPTHADHHMTINLEAILEPCAKFVRLSEGEQYCTLPSVPSRFKACISALVPNYQSDSSNLRRLKLCMQEALNSRLGFILTQPNIALAAAALHPRYGALDCVDANNVKDGVWSALGIWALQYYLSVPASDNGPASQLGREPPTHAQVTAAFNIVRRHFEDPRINYNNIEIDPLAWWADAIKRNSSLQVVEHIARVILAIPATSAPAERVFSAMKLLMPRLRSQLDGFRLEMMVIVREYMKEVGEKEFIDRLAKFFETDTRITDLFK